MLSLVLVVAIFYYLFTKLDPAQVWAAITAMTWQELATLGLLAVWNLCTYALVRNLKPAGSLRCPGRFGHQE